MGFHPGRRAYPISTNTSNSISNKKGWMVGTNATHGIGIAVNLWCNPLTKAKALATYGVINTWDVSQVTDMSELFYYSPTFFPPHQLFSCFFYLQPLIIY